MKLNYIPVLNMLLITDSLGLHTICILKKTSSKGAKLAFWVKIQTRFQKSWDTVQIVNKKGMQ